MASVSISCPSCSATDGVVRKNNCDLFLCGTPSAFLRP
ncbi:hypothetical protein FHA92_16970 [Escherichia coli]|nr:hypothetical protein [Escherichia coli]